MRYKLSNIRHLALLLSLSMVSFSAAAFNNSFEKFDKYHDYSNGCTVNGVSKVLKNCSLPYFVHLDDGEEVTLATNGPLKLFARCSLNTFNEEEQELVDQVEVLVTSSVDGWLEEDNESTIQTAGEEIRVMREKGDLGEERYDNDIDEGSAIAPGGYYIGFDGESTGLGLNIMGHDCTLVGSVILMKQVQKHY